MGVNLVVLAYDDRAACDAGAVHLDARVHPGDRRAPGQINLALVSKNREQAAKGYRHCACYSLEQVTAIVTAAGDNFADLTDGTGAVVGKVYGVKADLLIHDGQVVLNTKTLTPTELSVGVDADGNDIRSQIAWSTDAAKRARAAAREATASEK